MRYEHFAIQLSDGNYCVLQLIRRPYRPGLTIGVRVLLAIAGLNHTGAHGTLTAEPLGGH